VGALIGLLLALTLFAPATWVAAAVDRASGGQVQLIDASGTLWNGSARLLLTGGSGSRDQAALPGQLRWRLRPAWTAFSLQLNTDCCTPVPLQMRIDPNWDGARVQVADGQSQWPAAVLAGLGTPWNTVQADGTLSLSTQGFSLTSNAGRISMTGNAVITALGISSQLSTLKPMGSYRLAVTGGNAPALDLTTLEGSLQLTGNGKWVGSRLRFEGEARAAPEHEAALANLLNIIGRRSGARSIITLG
jgi:general secretion pathway protein N